jgi:hypothetical protein
MFAFYALILAVITMIPMFVPKGNLDENFNNKFSVIIPVTIAYFLFDWFILWYAMPSFAYPMAGGALFLVIIQFIISSLVNFRAINLIFPIGTILIFLFYNWVSTSAFFHAADYANLIGKISDNQTIKHWSQDIEPIDPTHIRLVPEETAITLARTSLNQNATSSTQTSVGSQFNLDEEHITLQKVKDKLVYVIPLDHRSFSTYTSVKEIPGYVIIDAENPQAQPKYVDKYAMKYSPESYFQHNLERHLYTNGYSDKILTDYSFELDDNGEPYWVVTVCKPSIGWSGIVVEGVVIVDPKDGKMQFKSTKEVPEWVDRVYPSNLVKDYLSYYGEYSGGWWNGFWANLNVKNPEAVTLNYGSDGKCYYVTPMTSANNKDASMTDLMYTDTKTGITKRYIVGGTTEDNLIEAVTTKLAYQHLHGEHIIYENVYGKMTGIVSVLGEDGSYRGAAFIDATNKNLIAYDVLPLNALHLYQNLISQNGQQIATDNASDMKTIKTIVSRLRYEQTTSGLQLDLYIDTIPHAFYVNCNTYADAPFTEKGDTIIISYYNTPASGISVNAFKNEHIHILSSANQVSVANQNQTSATSQKKSNDAKDFRGKVNEMTDEQIDSMRRK